MWNSCKFPECENWARRADGDFCSSHEDTLRKEAETSRKQSEKREQLLNKAKQRKVSNEDVKKITSLFDANVKISEIAKRVGRVHYVVQHCLKKHRNYIPKHTKGLPVKIRLENNSMPEPNTGCWLWTGMVNNNGYGVIKIKGFSSAQLTHRLSYEINKGVIPNGFSVLHKCDTPACINPEHLFLGTHKDNMVDMVNKGRHGSRKRIRKVSPKREELNKEYFKLVEQFKKDNPECKAKVNEYCTKETDDPHHKRGRGKYLLDVSTWIPVCRSCHIWIGNNHKEAEAKGFISSRLAKQTPTI